MFNFLKEWGHWACLIYLWTQVLIFITIGAICFHAGNTHNDMQVDAGPVNL